MQIERAGSTLREIARYLDENHDLAISTHNEIVNRVVGTGLGIEQASVLRGGEPAQEFNREVDLLWQEWSFRPETTQELPLGELERLICRSYARDGEVLIHHVTAARYPYRTGVPYVVEALEADYLPLDLYADDPRVVQGIEKDGRGRPVRYWIYRSHPGDIGRAGGTIARTDRDLKRVPARAISHIKHIKRLRQTRGVPIIHGCISRLEDIKEYEESERIAARMNADIGGIIHSDGTPIGEPSGGSDGERVQELEHANGMWWTVINGSGQKVEILDAKRPNTALEAFRDSQVRMVAAGSGTRYSPIARNFNGTYSSQRQELVEADVDYAKIREYLVGVFYAPMRRYFIDSAILAGQITMPSALDLRSLYWADYRGPAMPQIDIQKEMNGREIAERNGWTSRTQNTRDLGNDPRIVERQRTMEAASDPVESDDNDKSDSSGQVISWRS